MTSMKISDRTLSIFKNFSTIHESIVIDPGQTVYTSRDGSVFAWADVEEEFENKISIYKLANFISIVERFETPDIDFGEMVATIKSNRSRVKYKYANPIHMKFS